MKREKGDSCSFLDHNPPFYGYLIFPMPVKSLSTRQSNCGGLDWTREQLNLASYKSQQKSHLLHFIHRKKKKEKKKQVALYLCLP
jgi:hypothetical protein